MINMIMALVLLPYIHNLMYKVEVLVRPSFDTDDNLMAFDLFIIDKKRCYAGLLYD